MPPLDESWQGGAKRNLADRRVRLDTSLKGTRRLGSPGDQATGEPDRESAHLRTHLVAGSRCLHGSPEGNGLTPLVFPRP
jgi:hypothetical protein